MIRIESLVKKFPYRDKNNQMSWKTAVDAVSFENTQGEKSSRSPGTKWRGQDHDHPHAHNAAGADSGHNPVMLDSRWPGMSAR